MTISRLVFPIALGLMLALPAQAQRNVVIFVADGLRYSSVTPETAPTMAKLRRQGVDFSNSHAVYPTLTTANASAIATGHFLGDTGDYANTLYTVFPVSCRFGMTVNFPGRRLHLARGKGAFRRRVYGADHPAAGGARGGLQHGHRRQERPVGDPVSRRARQQGQRVDGPLGIFIDESTNRPDNYDGTPTKSTMLSGCWPPTSSTPPARPRPLSPRRPTSSSRIISLGDDPGADPGPQDSGKPFAMMFWSRDPRASGCHRPFVSGSVSTFLLKRWWRMKQLALMASQSGVECRL